ncbi:hypothetical protein M758_6G169800 [Ceratodon purpureus]|nr:hypothetical protein M758_6G169800 [Ceratodon purpureus]
MSASPHLRLPFKAHCYSREPLRHSPLSPSLPSAALSSRCQPSRQQHRLCLHTRSQPQGNTFPCLTFHLWWSCPGECIERSGWCVQFPGPDLSCVDANAVVVWCGVRVGWGV